MKRFFLLLRPARRGRGQALVEMALVLPFLVLILLGTIELSYYVYTYSELEYATRRASERAYAAPPIKINDANNPNDACVAQIRDDALKGITLSNRQNVNIELEFLGQRIKGDQISVTVEYNGQFLTPIGTKFFGNALHFEFTSRRTITDIPPSC